MSKTPILIVMLTYNDLTLKNAYQIFDSCKSAQAVYWGIKEEPLELYEMQKIFKYMKECGKKTVLEVVCYDEDGGYRGAEKAVQCGCDYLMGTVYHDSINRLCLSHGIKYLPYVGKVSGRPSILEGSAEEITAEAKEYLKKGVYGIDLLGYRYTGGTDTSDAADSAAYFFMERFVREIKAPVCTAGSINSMQRLNEIKRISPWAFTIGGAFFENKFGRSFSEQADRVCRFMEQEEFAAYGV